MTPKLPPLPPLPTRTVSTNLTDHDLDRLDHIRRLSPDLPPRAVLIRDAVRLWLHLQEDPTTAIGLLIDDLAIIYGVESPAADLIGSPQGTA